MSPKFRHVPALLAALALLQTPSASAAPRVPEVFLPGLVSLPGQEEYRIAFTPDGRTAFWGVGEELFPVSRQATIVYSEWRHGRWSEPRVAPFSGVHSDIDPFISPDGRRLFFSSIRPVNGAPRADVELWVVERRGNGWSEPRHLGAAVNSTSDELYPSVDACGTLYFGSDRPGGYGIWDIWRAYPRADGTYGPAENLGPAINTESLDFNPTITPDGDTLLFASIGREDGFGYGDLYMAERVRGRWRPAHNLGPQVNTAQDEYHPSLSPDGRTLYFVRHEYEPEYLPADLFHVRTRGLLGPHVAHDADADSEE
ncbi:PD40 domain-containing protein [Pyxidicoccus trucidator]|uniref:PD40 domain-containing protein n=1 Tax=Pyxidicoccus trucidator TaxID=2709662 RepID=UPI0013D93767|nr:PD40 domain-containing protein [Pyxidicoccus trucidator]